MTFNDIISLCNPHSISGPIPDMIGHIVQDSRKVNPGDVFVAIRGTQSDGHDFIPKAASAGASVIIAETKVLVPDSVSLLVVPIPGNF